MTLQLTRALQPLAEGRTVRVPILADGDRAVAAAWCEATGNTLTRAGADFVEVMRGRPAPVQVPAQRRPGARLWMYTNFDCNLACDYCCVRSSPRTPRRPLGLERVRQLVSEAVPAGVAELFLTGGEPFLLPEIGELVGACTGTLPTTLLTNGMLFQGRRLETLKAMPRENLALQISLDAAEAGPHDRHRGRGSWRRARGGVEAALGLGFRVRLAATLTTDADEVAQRSALNDLCDRLGVPDQDRIIRKQARRGLAEEGLVLTSESVIPEVTVTSDGIYWHPVGADDADMLVSHEIFPLRASIDRVRELVEAQISGAHGLAQAFVCA